MSAALESSRMEAEALEKSMVLRRLSDSEVKVSNAEFLRLVALVRQFPALQEEVVRQRVQLSVMSVKAQNDESTLRRRKAAPSSSSGAGGSSSSSGNERQRSALSLLNTLGGGVQEAHASASGYRHSSSSGALSSSHSSREITTVGDDTELLPSSSPNRAGPKPALSSSSSSSSSSNIPSINASSSSSGAGSSSSSVRKASSNPLLSLGLGLGLNLGTNSNTAAAAAATGTNSTANSTPNNHTHAHTHTHSHAHALDLETLGKQQTLLKKQNLVLFFKGLAAWALCYIFGYTFDMVSVPRAMPGLPPLLNKSLPPAALSPSPSPGHWPSLPSLPSLPLSEVNSSAAFAMLMHSMGFSLFLLYFTGQIRWLALNGVVGLAIMWAFNLTGMEARWIVFSTHSVGYILLAIVIVVMVLVFGGVVLVWTNLMEFLTDILARYPEVKDELSENALLEQVVSRYKGAGASAGSAGSAGGGIGSSSSSSSSGVGNIGSGSGFGTGTGVGSSRGSSTNSLAGLRRDGGNTNSSSSSSSSSKGRRAGDRDRDRDRDRDGFVIGGGGGGGGGGSGYASTSGGSDKDVESPHTSPSSSTGNLHRAAVNSTGTARRSLSDEHIHSIAAATAELSSALSFAAALTTPKTPTSASSSASAAAAHDGQINPQTGPLSLPGLSSSTHNLTCLPILPARRQGACFFCLSHPSSCLVPACTGWQSQGQGQGDRVSDAGDHHGSPGQQQSGGKDGSHDSSSSSSSKIPTCTPYTDLASQRGALLLRVEELTARVRELELEAAAATTAAT